VTQKQRRALSIALRAAAIAAVAVGGFLLARRLDLRRVGAALLDASLPLVAAAAALNLVQVLWRALCLRAMLAPTRLIPTASLVRYNLAMYAANNLLPGRAGELVRIQLLASREGVPATTTAAVALIEKVFDVVALLLLVLPLPWLLPGLPPSVARAMVGLGALGAAALAGSFAVARWGARAGGWIPRFARGAEAVRRPRPFAAALGWSRVANAPDAAEVVVCLYAVGIHVPAAASLLVLLAVAVALSVPSTPSGFGAMELSAVAALGMLGVPAERALAFGLVYHVMQLLPVTVLGLEGIFAASSAKSLRALDGASAVPNLVERS
jgi:uncharacterized membrane protein YbhN (UPF0104 family)